MNFSTLAAANRTCFCPGMTEPTPDQIEQLAHAFKRFTHCFKLAEAAAAAQNALYLLEAQTLIFIADNPGCGVNDCAKHFNVVPTTMSSAIERLDKHSLVERRRPEVDRRSTALSATEKGREAAARTELAYLGLCQKMLVSLKPSERREFIRLARKIAHSDV